MEPQAQQHISVCICTYKRPRLLERLLAALRQQQTGDRFRFSVIIVDNDNAESARSLVESCSREYPVELAYSVEPEQNIALARNRAVGMAPGGLLAFIDDDEYPEPAWLLTLYDALTRLRADAVLGPVLPYFLSPPPLWVVKSKIFERPRPATGTVLHWTLTRTGNILLRRELFDNNRFRVEFGSGGEDRDCFRRMIQAGSRFVWCDEAPVHEAIPPERCRRSVLLRRALLRGKIPYNHTWSCAAKSLLAIPAYSLALPFLVAARHDLFMKNLISCCDHVGRILALMKIDIIKEKYIS